MPSFYPENNDPLASDDELRALGKVCQRLYDLYAPGVTTPFPEGNRPLPSDSEQRLAIKINALQP